MLDSLRRRLQPDVWQDVRAGFEGWYYKAQTAEGEIFCVIPGISRQPDDPHSFIQLLDGFGTRYLRYPVEAFTGAADRLEVHVGNSVFTAEGYRLCTPEIQAEIRFSSPVPYCPRRYTLGVMGPFALLPGVECRHGIVLADSRADGFFRWENGARQITGGRGYVEKDWGRAFPHSYVWCHAFLDDGASFMLSAATVPLGRACVRGVIAFLRTREGWRKWATYTGARVVSACSLPGGAATLRVASPGSSLEVTLRPGAEGTLAAPSAAGMSRQVRESTAGLLELCVTGHGGVARYRAACGLACIEICGDPASLAAGRAQG